MVRLRYLSSFWIILEMHLINCEITFDPNWSKKCVIATTDVSNQSIKFSTIDKKHYDSVATLSTKENAKLLA